jgi:hypothetical protein
MRTLRFVPCAAFLALIGGGFSCQSDLSSLLNDSPEAAGSEDESNTENGEPDPAPAITNYEPPNTSTPDNSDPHDSGAPPPPMPPTSSGSTSGLGGSSGSGGAAQSEPSGTGIIPGAGGGGAPAQSSGGSAGAGITQGGGGSTAGNSAGGNGNSGGENAVGGSSVGGSAGASVGGANSTAGSGGAQQALGLVLQSSIPLQGATAVNAATDVVLTFNRTILLGTGAVTLRRATDQSEVESVPFNDERVTLDGATLTVDFDNLLGSLTDYAVSVSADSITDEEANVFSALSDDAPLAFKTEAIAFPGTVESGLLLWLDAAHAASLKTDTGVRLWADRSGQNNNVTQAGATAQPALLAAGINNNTSLRFDGTDDVLSAALGFAIDSFDGFVVWRSSIAPPTNRKSEILRNGDHFELNHGHYSATPRHTFSSLFSDNNTLWYNSSFAAPETNTAYLWNFSFDDVSLMLAARTQGAGPMPMFGIGGLPPAPTTPPFPPRVPFTVGNDDTGALAFTGDIAEVLLYSRVLSASERKAVTAYLNDKWGTGFASCEVGTTQGRAGWDQRCHVVLGTAASWSDARTACQALGTGWDLASPRDATNNAVLIGVLANSDATQAWLAGTEATAGAWQWSDGTAFWNGDDGGAAVSGAFTQWSSQQPTSAGSGCLTLNAAADAGEGSWADQACSTEAAALCSGPL